MSLGEGDRTNKVQPTFLTAQPRYQSKYVFLWKISHWAAARLLILTYFTDQFSTVIDGLWMLLPYQHQLLTNDYNFNVKMRSICKYLYFPLYDSFLWTPEALTPLLSCDQRSRTTRCDYVRDNNVMEAALLKTPANLTRPTSVCIQIYKEVVCKMCQRWNTAEIPRTSETFNETSPDSYSAKKTTIQNKTFTFKVPSTFYMSKNKWGCRNFH